MTNQKPYSRALTAIAILITLMLVGLPFGIGLAVDTTPTPTEPPAQPTPTVTLTLTPTSELTPVPEPTVENAGGFQPPAASTPPSNGDSTLKQIWDWVGNNVWAPITAFLVGIGYITQVFGQISLKSLKSRFQRPKWQRITPAKEGEILVIVAEFERRGVQTVESKTMLDQLQDSINAAISDDRLAKLPFRFEHTSTIVADSRNARNILDTKNATLVIWGSVANSIITTYYEIAPRWGYEVQSAIAKTDFKAQLSASIPLLDQVTYRFENAIDQHYVTTFTLAQLLCSNKQYASALPLFESALKLVCAETLDVQRERNAAVIWFYIGNIRHEFQNDLINAEQAYSFGIELNESFASAYYNRGLARYKQGHLDQTIDDFSKAISLKPHYASAHNNRGNVLLLQGNLEQAINDFKNAITLDSQGTSAWYNRGLAYYKKQDLDKAVSDFTQATKLNPHDGDSFFNCGVIHSAQGNLVEHQVEGARKKR